MSSAVEPNPVAPAPAHPHGATTPAATPAPGGPSRTRQVAVIAAAQACVFALALGAWWLLTDVMAQPGSISAAFSPTDALPAWVEGIQDGTLTSHAAMSLLRLLSGLGIAFAIGIPLGIMLGSIGWLRNATGGLMHMLRMTSPLSWAPLAVIIFGVGHAPVIALVAIAAVWPLTLATIAGVRAVDPEWLLLARSMGASRWEQIRTVVVPAVRVPVLNATRIALGIAWIVLVPAEMLGVDSGLGYAVLNARDQLAYDDLMAAILTIGVLGLLLDLLAGPLISRRR